MSCYKHIYVHVSLELTPSKSTIHYYFLLQCLKPGTQGVASSLRLAKILCSLPKSFDQTHEHNARERRNRI